MKSANEALLPVIRTLLVTPAPLRISLSIFSLALSVLVADVLDADVLDVLDVLDVEEMPVTTLSVSFF